MTDAPSPPMSPDDARTPETGFREAGPGIHRLPAERCYWVRLEPGSQPWSPHLIRSKAQEWLPVPFDSLIMTWRIAADRRVLVTGVDRSTLSTALTAQPTPWMIIPDRIPEHVAVDDITVDALDFLCRCPPPPHLRRLQILSSALAIGVVAIVSAALLVGSWRRHAIRVTHQAELDSEAATAIASSLSPMVSGPTEDIPTLIARVEQTIAPLQHFAEPARARPASIYLALARSWPSELRVETSSLLIDAQRLAIAGQAAKVEDAQALARTIADSISTQDRWRMQPLQAGNDAGGVAFSIQAVRE